MIVLISQITGISDIAALLAIFGINAGMILFGALQEKYEKPGQPGWRYNIFRSELPLVLEAIRYGDRTLFEINTKLDYVPVYIYFQSTKKRFNNIEQWGTMSNYVI
jgi:hypothetical protein